MEWNDTFESDISPGVIKHLNYNKDDGHVLINKEGKLVASIVY